MTYTSLTMHLVQNVAAVFTLYSLTYSPAVLATDERYQRLVDSTSYWSPWSSYSPCSATCGSGYKSRTRQCFSHTSSYPQCVGLDKDLLPCYLDPCDACRDRLDKCNQYQGDVCFNPIFQTWVKQNCEKYCGLCQSFASSTTASVRIDGGWTTWSSFSACSATCGGGSMYRYRTCTNPAPSGGGMVCLGHDRESYGCFIQKCPTTPAPYTDWGPWSSFGACSVTCGNGEKVRERTRYCTGNSQCKLVGYDSDNCTERPCPINGRWGFWSSWSKCSVSCDLGILSRSRSCDNPVPSYGGANCVGDDVDTRDCTMGPCPVWSHWFEGDCSASCGNGTRERLRHCSTGRDVDCIGKAFELVPCIQSRCI